MRRLLIIASREYVGYARTAGFWLALAVIPISAAIGGGLPILIDRATPQRTLAVVDLTGQGYAARIGERFAERTRASAAQAMAVAARVAAGPDAGEAVDAAFERGGEPAARAELSRVAPDVARAFKAPEPPFRVVAAPPDLPRGREAVNAALRPYIAGERKPADGGTLNAAAVIHAESPGGALGVDLWSANLSDRALETAVRDAVREELRAERLRAAGLAPDLLARIDDLAPEVRVLSPKAAAGEVSLRDRLPTVVGFALGVGLWALILTGAGVLMNSVMEEKSGRILEILASSASTVEIMGGKILGVALLTLTLLGVWAGLGALIVAYTAPGLAQDVLSALTADGLLVQFGLYAVLGYLMYAAMFAAIGAFCETPRDAQTLVTPIMLLLFVPLLLMTFAIENPAMPALRALSWFPPFTPFLMLARAGEEVAWWETAGALALMAVTTAVVIQLSGRAFKAGALSTGRLGPGEVARAAARVLRRA